MFTWGTTLVEQLLSKEVLQLWYQLCLLGLWSLTCCLRPYLREFRRFFLQPLKDAYLIAGSEVRTNRHVLLNFLFLTLLLVNQTLFYLRMLKVILGLFNDRKNYISIFWSCSKDCLFYFCCFCEF